VARLQELDRLKSEFIQNASHELRMPLALILGYAEMLDMGEMGELEPEQREAVGVITRRARMLRDLVEDITFILQAETNLPDPEPVRLDELTLAVVKEFQIAVQEAGLTLRTDIARGLPPVYASPTYMRRVMDNLIGNAIKFTPEGGAITISGWREGDCVALEVSDTGIGIPADKLDHVFERFYQVDGSATRRYGGVGLGLALMKEVVEAYGGRVAVDSEMDVGSTFTAILPTCRDAD
jgi:adenylate cyclase